MSGSPRPSTASPERVLPTQEDIDAKLAAAAAVLKGDGFLSSARVDAEVGRFRSVLRFPPLYYGTFDEQAIASHIEAFAAAKRLCMLGRDDASDVTGLVHSVEVATAHAGCNAYALYFAAAPPYDTSVRRSDTPQARVEAAIARYIHTNRAGFVADPTQCLTSPTSKVPLSGPFTHGWSVQCFRSFGPAVEGGRVDVLLYVVTWSPFEAEFPSGEVPTTKDFNSRKRIHVRARYFDALRAQDSGRLEVTRGVSLDDGLPILLVAVDADRLSYLQELSQAVGKYDGVRVMRKFCETFEGATREVHAIYLAKAGPPGSTPEAVDPAVLAAITHEVQYIDIVPMGRPLSTSATAVLREKGVLADLKPTRVAYLHAATMFSFYFSRLGPTLGAEAAATAAIVAHRPLLEEMYADFVAHVGATAMQPVNEALRHRVRTTVAMADHVEVFEAFIAFNAAVARTNFTRDEKRALSFRLIPSVIQAALGSFSQHGGAGLSVAEVPFAITLVCGSQFRAFHVRYRDVARGGIRVVQSRDEPSHVANKRQCLDEALRLAHTQLLKNKDIPEGGSKAVILIAPQYAGRVQSLFERFIDAMMDVIVPLPEVINRLTTEEVVFFGPDEGTATLMDAAMGHARSREYPQWRAITTGKSPAAGGIPHDTYGMTTRSIREYVDGISAKLGLDPAQCTKLQIGGPDGDLGSNEILRSRERTVGVVDGDGVAYDPQGLDAEELRRLARRRATVAHFNRKLLGPGGYVLLCSDKGVALPSGEVVENGTAFRNGFHLRDDISADFFVPCGGRPSSVTEATVGRLLTDAGGRPRLKFKYIVEGANLFFTEAARILLEKGGVVMFKDAATNKGGVTSSSLEVQSGLGLPDDKYDALMCEHPGKPVPEFRQRYIEHIISRIQANAKAEFELLWRLHAEGGPAGPTRTELVGKVSRKIVQLRDSLMAFGVVKVGTPLFRSTISVALPAPLLEVVTLDELCKRMPDAYLEAVVAAHLASHYVYTMGLDANEVAFVKYIAEAAAPPK